MLEKQADERSCSNGHGDWEGSPGAIIISEEYEIRQSVPGIIASYEVNKCKKSDKNAVLAYSIDNAGEAKKIWIEKPGEAISASSGFTTSADTRTKVKG